MEAFRDQTRRGIGKSQSTWNRFQYGTSGPPRVGLLALLEHPAGVDPGAALHQLSRSTHAGPCHDRRPRLGRGLRLTLVPRAAATRVLGAARCRGGAAQRGAPPQASVSGCTLVKSTNHASKRKVVESWWVSKPLAFAGHQQPRRRNEWRGGSHPTQPPAPRPTRKYRAAHPPVAGCSGGGRGEVPEGALISASRSPSSVRSVTEL
jgi:hypothetical protein